jgi:ankyrin repeat protein
LGDWTSPLESAAINGYVDIAKLLVWAGADVNLNLNSEGTALMSASAHGQIDVVRLLVEAGADVNLMSNNRGTALLLAAINAHQDVFNYLLSRSSLELRKWSVITALKTAATNGDIRIIQLLCQFACDLEAKDEYGRTALMTAAEWHQVEVVEALIETELNINAKDFQSTTALMLASQYRTREESRAQEASRYQAAVVQILLENGADPYLIDDQGRNALILAAAFGSSEVVELLIQAGTNSSIRDNNGKVALEYAQSREAITKVEQIHRSYILHLLQVARAN